MISRTKQALVAARDIILFLYDYVFFALQGRGRGNSSVLLVRLDEIGDFILWLDSARGLKELYRDRSLILAANSVWADLAKSTGLFDRVIGVDVRRLRIDFPYRLSLLKSLGREGASTVVHPTYGRARHFIDAESIVRTVGAKERFGSVGHDRRSWRSRLGAFSYTRLLPSAPTFMMELLRNAEFVRLMGLSDFKAHAPRWPEIDRLPGLCIGQKPYYVLFPGAGHNRRRWPLDRFAAVAEKLHSTTGWRGVICGSMAEQSLGHDIVRYCAKDWLSNLTGQTDLLELMGVLRDAELVIANETSAVHMASAVGTRVVCILGGGHYGKFVPYAVEADDDGGSCLRAVCAQMACFNCDWKCKFKIPSGQPFPCVARVTADQVWQEIKSMIGQPGTGIVADA